MLRHKTQLDLLQELAGEGIVQTDPRFNRLFLKKAVEACRDSRRVTSCDNCSFQLNCETYSGYLREVKYGTPTKKVETFDSVDIDL